MRRTQSPRKAARARKTAVGSYRHIQEEMAQELYAIVRRALSGLGVSVARQKQAVRRAFRPGKTPCASGRVRRNAHELGDLLLFWRNDPSCLGPDGGAQTLPIRGPGVSFESLARRFLPGVSLDQALQLLLTHTEVTPRPGG